MKRNFLWIALCFFISLPLLSLSEDNDGEGKITFLKGNCLLKRGNEEYKKCSLNQLVYSSDSIKTLKDSQVEITLLDKNTIIITEDSEVTIHQSTVREKRYTSIGLLFGSIKLFVKKLSPDDEQFLVNTITTIVGVRGTQFDVSVREDGAVLINVDEGIIETEYNNTVHKILGGNASIFYLSEDRDDFKEKIDHRKWKKEAIKKIKENPSLFLKKMLERERIIIQRLKDSQKHIEKYRKDWITFLRRIRYLENRGMYEEEKKLISLQITRTKKVIVFFIRARANLAIIRSIIILTYRIEKNLDPETAKKLPAINELRKEYERLSHVIQKLDESERQLKKVLFVLNKKYDEINIKLQKQ